MSLGNSKCAAHPGPIVLRGLRPHHAQHSSTARDSRNGLRTGLARQCRHAAQGRSRWTLGTEPDKARPRLTPTSLLRGKREPFVDTLLAAGEDLEFSECQI